MRFVVFAIAALIAAGSGKYDPVALLPDSYSLQFENDWVKVVRVRYAPHARLPAHAHPSRASAYVYLNDSGPVIFRHVGEKKFAATRPPTSTGSFRVFRGLDEIHEVENTSDLPSEFLRVEFKTEPLEVNALRGRFHREATAAGESLQKVQFENGQVRITRLVCAPGKSLTLTALPAEPALLIELTAPAGTPHWLPSGATESVRADRTTARELLRFDFKTRPAR